MSRALASKMVPQTTVLGHMCMLESTFIFPAKSSFKVKTPGAAHTDTARGKCCRNCRGRDGGKVTKTVITSSARSWVESGRGYGSSTFCLQFAISAIEQQRESLFRMNTRYQTIGSPNNISWFCLASRCQDFDFPAPPFGCQPTGGWGWQQRPDRKMLSTLARRVVVLKHDLVVSIWV